LLLLLGEHTQEQQPSQPSSADCTSDRYLRTTLEREPVFFTLVPAQGWFGEAHAGWGQALELFVALAQTTTPTGSVGSWRDSTTEPVTALVAELP
jgi:hypothetical protein